MRDFIQENRTLDTSFDIIMQGDTTGEDSNHAKEKVRNWSDAGVTWWLEAQWSLTDAMWDPKTQDQIHQRLSLGPPRFE